jgi:DNA polymerase-3 subunit beta
MKWTCNSTELQKAVAIVEKAVPAKTSAPVLENLQLTLNNNQLTLRGYDTHIGIEFKLPIETVESAGETLVKAKSLASILSKIPNQTITVSVDQGNRMKIQGHQIDFDILCMPNSEYPALPAIESGTVFTFKAEEIKELIRHTLFSMSNDESRKFLNGILFKSQGDSVMFISTDGYRLSFKSQKIAPQEKDCEAIIPAKTIQELYKILQQSSPDQLIEMVISERQVMISMPSILIFSRVLEGRFPDYKQLTPSSYSNTFLLSRRAFLEACERANIVSSFSHDVVRFLLNDQEIVIQANAQSFGDFQEKLQLNRETGSDEVKVAFNVKLVIDALRNTDSDEVKFSINGQVGPCLFEPQPSSDYFYVVMPIRTNDYQMASPAPAAAAAPESPVPTPQEEAPEFAGVEINPFYKEPVSVPAVEVFESGLN